MTKLDVEQPKQIDHQNDNQKIQNFCYCSLQTNKTQPNGICSLPVINRSRQRWNLLSKAVKSKEFSLRDLRIDDHNHDDYRRKSSNIEPNLSPLIDSFGLICYQYENSTGPWIECCWNHYVDNGSGDKDYAQNDKMKIFIRFVDDRLSFKDLVGFDNSGNVRLWASEELLAFVMASNRQLTKDKVICELGSGMTALAGLMIGAIGLHRQLYLTDGNQRCVDNIKEIVERNFPEPNDHNIKAQKLCWNQAEDLADEFKHRCDIVLGADCLFMEQSHFDLLNTIDQLLIIDDVKKEDPKGVVYIAAPSRGQSFQRFVDLVRSDNRFTCSINTTSYETENEESHADSIFNQFINSAHYKKSSSFHHSSNRPFLLVMRRCYNRF